MATSQKKVIFAEIYLELTKLIYLMSITKNDFAAKVRRKIAGWYDNEEYEKRAIDRIVRQREQIISLLEKVRLCDTSKLLEYLDKSGFYYRPSSANRHHNFPGGLAEHSLGVYNIMNEWNTMSANERSKSELYRRFIKGKPVACDILNEKMWYGQMLITALCHDLCKAKHYYFEGRRIKAHNSDPEPRRMHSGLSVKRLKENDINTTGVLQAVNTHMRLYSPPRNDAEAKRQEISRKSILAIAVWAADKLDASRHPAGRRHSDL